LTKEDIFYILILSGQYHHMVATITMHTEELEKIGLSKNEAKIYEVLLYLTQASVSEIAQKSNIHRRNVYDSLNRLIEKGLVFQIFQNKENNYSAVEPKNLLDILKEREKSLQKVIPSLEKIYFQKPLQEAAFIYKGLEGYKNYMKDLIRVGETVYFLSAKAMWFTPGIPKFFLENFKREMKRKKMDYYTIFDYQVKKTLPKAISKVGGKYRILPEKYSTKGVCDIFGDYIVSFTGVNVGNFGDNGTIFVIRNKELAESYKTWFQFIWDFCKNPASRIPLHST